MLQLLRRFLLILPVATLLAACSPRPSGDRPRAEYDTATGHLSKIELDANKNGTNDTVSYMDGTRVIRVELDLDENGKVERWDFYGADGKLEKVGFASKDDGVMDSQAFYDSNGATRRIEISTRRNNRFDRTEYYDKKALVKSEDDTNGDGRPDKWDFYMPRSNPAAGEPPYAISSTEFDDSGSGRPERRFVYGADGRIAKVEFDEGGTGQWHARASDK